MFRIIRWIYRPWVRMVRQMGHQVPRRRLQQRVATRQQHSHQQQQQHQQQHQEATAAASPTATAITAAAAATRNSNCSWATIRLTPAGVTVSLIKNKQTNAISISIELSNQKLRTTSSTTPYIKCTPLLYITIYNYRARYSQQISTNQPTTASITTSPHSKCRQQLKSWTKKKKMYKEKSIKNAQMSNELNWTLNKKPQAINELSINIALKVLIENNPNIISIHQSSTHFDTQEIKPNQQTLIKKKLSS